MRYFKESSRELRSRGVIVAFLVLVFGFLFTYLFWQRFTEVSRLERQVLFSQKIEGAEGLLHTRLEIYTTLLYGARGYFSAGSTVTKEDWHAYVNSLDLAKNIQILLLLRMHRLFWIKTKQHLFRK